MRLQMNIDLGDMFRTNATATTNDRCPAFYPPLRPLQVSLRPKIGTDIKQRVIGLGVFTYRRKGIGIDT